MTGDLIRTGKRALPEQGHLERPEVDKSRFPPGSLAFQTPFISDLQPSGLQENVCLFVCFKLNLKDSVSKVIDKQCRREH